MGILTTSTIDLDAILNLVREQSGVDFRAYRRPMIERRTMARLRAVRSADFADYYERLRSDPAESGNLIQYLTIKVSRFCRDAFVFDLLEQAALPDLARRSTGGPLRLWSAGCGRGEEPYSLAILLEELRGNGFPLAAEIYGTDIDEGALAAARLGRFPAAALDELSVARRERYFSIEDSRHGPEYVLAERLRAGVRFMHHDLATAAEAPDGRVFDLICCRNVLIYFDRACQTRVFDLLLRSLVPGGYLCLGEVEWPPAPAMAAFEVVDRKGRLFQRRAVPKA